MKDLMAPPSGNLWGRGARLAASGSSQACRAAGCFCFTSVGGEAVIASDVHGACLLFSG